MGSKRVEERTFMLGDEDHPCFIEFSDSHGFDESESVWVYIDAYKPRYKQTFVDGKPKEVLASHKRVIGTGFGTSTSNLRAMAKSLAELADEVDAARERRVKHEEERKANRIALGKHFGTTPFDEILRNAE